jgi:hypothetical protein
VQLYDKKYKIFSENLKRTLETSRRKWKDIKLESHTEAVRVWAGFIWFRRGSWEHVKMNRWVIISITITLFHGE